MKTNCACKADCAPCQRGIYTTSPETVTEERYFIGVMGEGMRLGMKVGPKEWTKPAEPLLMADGTSLYPVSSKVFEAWLSDDYDEYEDIDA